MSALVRRQPVHTRTVRRRRWTQEAAEALQDCFESTDWDVLCEPHGEDIDNMTDCITEYTRFCEDTTVPARTVHCFSNNKPWITRDLKALLNKKKRAFRAGDREEQRRVQHELRDMLRTCKDNYRRKLEAKLQQNNLTPCQPPYEWLDPPPAFSCTAPLSAPLLLPHPLLHCINPNPTVTIGQVKRQLEKLHQRKAAGSDGITPRILKTCASQLSPVLGHLYNLSLSQEKVPMLWKTSCLVPVPKKSRPSDPADYRPVALTSHVMKVLERLVLAQLRPQVRMFLVPLQFAPIQSHLGVDDDVSTCCNEPICIWMVEEAL
ncbi:hypothetical protein L3Q82_003282 [Scortum barcoo]|uniref:Uncharacterized protein n=1 Tax=Scortum barcoo TaxID=214431 RepID=A0ACB8VSA4_9TELE|nr:hypothetical protein L3Q82_003282 [Scortum barcoo]